MQKKLHIFNPDNDIALANGDSHYVIPRSARKIGEDLAVLPCWYAPQGSAVLIPDKDTLNEWNSFRPSFHFFVSDEIEKYHDFSPQPWGWNPMLINTLRKMGVSETQLPNSEQMKRLRALSHRSTSVRLLQSLSLSFPFCGESKELFTDDEIRIYVENHPLCVLKEPLSGSGKGLFWCKGEYTDFIRHWAVKVMKGQNSVVGEPVYDKVKDFAMEFFAGTDGKVSFAGYSLFNTDERGVYHGNLLASDDEIESKLAHYVPISWLRELKEQLLERLSGMFQNDYTGYLGIDMMICRSESPPYFIIHPCVEMNLRMNMGMTARLLYDNYVFPGSEGMFWVDYHKDSCELSREHEERMRSYPLEMMEGRIYKGYLPLVPVRVDSSYIAYVLVK